MLQSSIYLFSFNLKAYRKINLQALSSPSLVKTRQDLFAFKTVLKSVHYRNHVLGKKPFDLKPLILKKLNSFEKFLQHL